MKKDAVLINFRIREKTKEALWNSDIHKTPMYLDEYEKYLLEKEKERERNIKIKISNEKIKANKFIPKSRNLINNFKNT